MVGQNELATFDNLVISPVNELGQLSGPSDNSYFVRDTHKFLYLLDIDEHHHVHNSIDVFKMSDELQPA